MRALELSLALSLVVAGCSAGAPPIDGVDGSTSMSDGGGTPGMDGSRPAVDAEVPDPFDPDGACGASVIPTERVPGSLLLVFDRSGSMDSEPSEGSGTRWDLSVGAINGVLASVSDELNVGLQLFPYASSGSDECTVELPGGSPNVPIAPLATSRSQIMSALSSTSPSGGTTPIYEATREGYRYLDTLSGPGQRGLIVVTDGGENCDQDERDAFLAEVEQERLENGYLTYAVGLDQSNNELSTMAYNGGTPRTPDCLPECRARTCFEDSECPSGLCAKDVDDSMFPGFPVPGECACRGDGDCPMPLTCQSDPNPYCGMFGFGDCTDRCQGTANCCHYDASGSEFESEFEGALEDIASRFLDSCVFDLPRGSDPSSFDPALVNVGVTFEGEERTVLRRSDDASVNSWSYTSDDHESIVIQGPICEQLLESPADVEIVLGCPTILI